MKVTIKGIIKENKEELIIDKISHYILEDTQYRDNLHRTRIMIHYPFDKNENYYTIEKVLPILLKRKENIDTRSPELLKYILYTYGVEDWDLIYKISQRYYSLLYDKIKELLESHNKPINESVERKEDTLNRIVDFMIQDTTWDVHMEHGDDWDYVQVTINYPGGDSDDYKTIDMKRDWDMFHTGYKDREYLEEQFGITEEWITQELYNRYINKLRSIIYEEMKNFEDNY